MWSYIVAHTEASDIFAVLPHGILRWLRAYKRVCVWVGVDVGVGVGMLGLGCNIVYIYFLFLLLLSIRYLV